MKRLITLSLVLMFLAFALPSFALDYGKLSSAMSMYATTSEWLNMVMHPGMPKPWTNPLYPQKIKQLGEAQDTMRKEVSSINTAEEMKKARALAESYKMCEGVYRDTGYQLEFMLNDREKFLQIHQ